MMVITQQIRAARSLLSWEQSKLAEASGVAISTVKRLEGLDGEITARPWTVEKIQKAFEAAGIEFIHGDRVGVVLADYYKRAVSAE